MKLPVDYTESSPNVRRLVRMQYIEEQNHKCWHCHRSLFGPPAAEVRDKEVNKKLFPDTFFDHPIHLQHDHDTGMTEGAVHAWCNAVLWQYEGR